MSRYNTLKEKYDTLENKLGILLRSACAFLLMILLCVVLLNIINRWLSFFSMPWYEEIILLCFSWALFLGTAEIWRTGTAFCADFLLTRIKQKKMLEAIGMASNVLCLITFFTLFYYSIKWIGGIHSTTAALKLPISIQYSCIPVSMFLMVVMTIRDLTGNLVMLNKINEQRGRE
jgi:TRAP-type C4-dicarboxylate transport system permease small subunit